MNVRTYDRALTSSPRDLARSAAPRPLHPRVQAVILAAGMKGIEQSMDLPREAEDDVWSLTERERTSLGIEPLPKSLNEAIEIAEKSELLAETLGEHVFDFFLRNKRAEWQDYRRQVTVYERDRYLPVL